MSPNTGSPARSWVNGTPSPARSPEINFSCVDAAIDCTLPLPDWDYPPDPRPTPPNLEIAHSREAQSLLGTVVPKNTRKCNLFALKALGTFCIRTFRRHREHLLHADDTERILEETRCLIFADGQGSYLPPGYSRWTEEQLKNIRFYLIKFVANYKNTKTGTYIAPTTLKTYVLGIQSGFSSLWNYDLKLLTGPIFNCPNEGFLSVIENKAREQQRDRKHVVSHNVLSRDDLLLLYRSPSLSKSTPNGFLRRLVFTIGILTAMRPTALASLTVSQFRKMNIREKTVWVISATIGSNCGASKTSKGGWSAIGEKVSEVCVWDEEYDGGSINFYSEIDEFMSLRTALEVGTDRFFLAVNGKATHRRDSFKRQHLGKSAFGACVKNACVAEGIEGSGQKGWVTTHGLRSTLATLLFGNGHSDSSVALRTGHRDPRSLKSYQNLRGLEGIRQQRDIFGAENDSSAKRARVETAVEKEGGIGLRGDLIPRVPLSNIGSVNGGTLNITLNYYGTEKEEYFSAVPSGTTVVIFLSL